MSKGFALPIIIVVVAIASVAVGSVFISSQNNQNNQNNNEVELVSKQANSVQESQFSSKDEQENKFEERKSNTSDNISNNNNQMLKSANKENKSQEQEKQTAIVKEKEAKEKNNTYSDPPKKGTFIYIDNELQLSASKVEGGINLNWSRCNSDQFVSYKIARSETASDVFYPRDGSIVSISNQNTLSYTDKNLQTNKTYYYRVCSLEKNGESWCGNVVSVNY